MLPLLCSARIWVVVYLISNMGFLFASFPFASAKEKEDYQEHNMVKPHDRLVLLGSMLTHFTPIAYQPGSLPGVFRAEDGGQMTEDRKDATSLLSPDHLLIAD